jgi:hypothetical protein
VSARTYVVMALLVTVSSVNLTALDSAPDTFRIALASVTVALAFVMGFNEAHRQLRRALRGD